MTELKIKLPDKLLKKTYEVSEKQNIPIDELIAASLAQKLYRFMPDPYLEERAKRSTGDGMAEFMSQTPDTMPEEYDKL